MTTPTADDWRYLYLHSEEQAKGLQQDLKRIRQTLKETRQELSEKRQEFRETRQELRAEWKKSDKLYGRLIELTTQKYGVSHESIPVTVQHPGGSNILYFDDYKGIVSKAGALQPDESQVINIETK